MAEENIRVQVLAVTDWARRLFPYMVFFVGAVLGSAAVIRILLPKTAVASLSAAMPPQRQLHELAWFGVALLLSWLAFGLLERNERSWKMYQLTGAALTGALGIGISIITVSDFVHWLTLKQAFSFEVGTPLFTTGLALIVWGIALLVNNRGASVLWQCAILPVSVYSFVLWYSQVTMALKDTPGRDPQVGPIIFSALYFAASMGILLMLSQLASQRRPTEKRVTNNPKEKRATNKWTPVQRSFPSAYHELLARGRFC